MKADKHRENYIGHSLKAPVGRWQKGTPFYCGFLNVFPISRLHMLINCASSCECSCCRLVNTSEVAAGMIVFSL